MKTATMVKVVAMTARPISSVPSSDACTWSLPRCRWRTMFSRTTMASSISMPMARLRPMSVITFRVKPNSRMTVKAAMTEMGRVRPVMTVDRQEFRNTNTMRTVRMPPRIMVRFTSWMESRMKLESSRTTWRDTSGGQLLRSLLHRLPDAVRHRHGVGPRLLDHVQGEGGSLVEQGQVLRLLHAVHHLADVAHEDGGAARALHGDARDLRGAPWPRAATRTRASVDPRSAEPAGKSTFSLRSASTTWASEMW